MALVATVGVIVVTITVAFTGVAALAVGIVIVVVAGAIDVAVKVVVVIVVTASVVVAAAVGLVAFTTGFVVDTGVSRELGVVTNGVIDVEVVVSAAATGFAVVDTLAVDATDLKDAVGAGSVMGETLEIADDVVVVAVVVVAVSVVAAALLTLNRD